MNLIQVQNQVLIVIYVTNMRILKKKSKQTTPKCSRGKLGAQKTNTASATKADVKTKTKRTKRLTKNEIHEICDHLDSNRDLLMDYMKKSVLEIKKQTQL